MGRHTMSTRNDDIVERLRALAVMYPQWGEVRDRAAEAADEIERLRRIVKGQAATR